MAQHDNQDYYKVGGRSGGPAGPLDQFKKQVSRSRSTLGRDQERVLPGERPVAGIKRGASRGGKKSAAVGSLPRVIGTAGVSSRAKAPRSRSSQEVEDVRRGQKAMAEAEQDMAVEDSASPTPSEAANPASPANPALFERERFSRPVFDFDLPASQDELPPTLEYPAWLRSVLRPFLPAMRLIGGAARILDPPVRFTLEVMQKVGRLADGFEAEGRSQTKGPLWARSACP